MTRVRAAVLLLAVVLGAAVASPAAAESRPTGSVRLVEQTSWLADGGSFSLHLAFDDVTTSEQLDVAITLHSRTRYRSDFEQSIEARPRGTVRTFPAIAVGLLGVDSRGNRVATLTLPQSGVASTPYTLPSNLRQGVYPVTVALKVHGGATLDSFVTHLVRLPSDPDVTPLSVAWVQPVGAAPALQPDGSSSLDPAERDDLADVIRTLDANAGLPLTLDVTPETAAALDADDLDRLKGSLTGDELLASPYVDVDPSALVGAGRGDDLPVQRQYGEDTLFDVLGDRGEPRSWSATRTLTEPALSRLRTLGVTRVVVPESSLTPLDDDFTRGRALTQPFDLSAGADEVVRATSVDPGLLAHFRNRGDQVLLAHRLLADLAVLFFDMPGSARGIVVRPPDGWQANEAFLDVVLGGLGDASILRPITLERYFDDVQPLEDDDEPIVRTVSSTATASGLPAARLADAHGALDELVSLAGATSDLAASVRTQLLVSESSRLSAADRNALLTGITDTRDRVRGRLELPNDRTYRLTAREGTLPLTIVNRNEFPVHARLQLSSDKLEFTQVKGGDRTRQSIDLDLPPGNHTLTVPVQARASGTFNLRAVLFAPDGAQLRTSRLTIRSTVFSGVGIILSIGAALFLLAWWAKHWRTSRRARHLVEAPAQAGA
jgi:hypothetical protein